METPAKLEAVYRQSENVVSREIEGEIIIVPLVSGIGDLDDELYSLNGTGRAVWERMDGTKDLSRIIGELIGTYNGPESEIRENVLGFASELLSRKIIVEA